MKEYAIGIDVGGTAIKMGIFSTKGYIIEKWQIKTDVTNEGNNIVGDITKSLKERMIKNSIDISSVIGIGAGIPGVVDKDQMVIECTNIGWKNFDFKEKLSKAINLNCVIGNDANVAALGEMWQGAAKGFENVLMVTLGTGVGGGVIVDGHIITGTHGAAGEIGHIPVKEESEEENYCNCGKKGCLEQYVSARGIANMAVSIMMKSSEPSPLKQINNISSKEVFDFALKGDGLAIKVTEEFGRILGKSLSQLTAVIDPEVILIGGGVSKAGNIVINLIEKYYMKYAFNPLKKVKFSLASLYNDAGIYGGAKLIIDKVRG